MATHQRLVVMRPTTRRVRSWPVPLKVRIEFRPSWRIAVSSGTSLSGQQVRWRLAMGACLSTQQLNSMRSRFARCSYAATAQSASCRILALASLRGCKPQHPGPQEPHAPLHPASRPPRVFTLPPTTTTASLLSGSVCPITTNAVSHINLRARPPAHRIASILTVSTNHHHIALLRHRVCGSEHGVSVVDRHLLKGARVEAGCGQGQGKDSAGGACVLAARQGGKGPGSGLGCSQSPWTQPREWLTQRVSHRRASRSIWSATAKASYPDLVSNCNS